MADRSSTVVQKVAYLNSKLGPTLVAASIGIRNRQAIIEVSDNLSEVLEEDQKVRLDAVLEIWATVSSAEGDDLARAWFIGANPWLKEESAITAIREDRFGELTIAAKAMIEDTPNF